MAHHYCVACFTPLSMDEKLNSNVCPYCGHVSETDVCETGVEVIYEEVKLHFMLSSIVVFVAIAAIILYLLAN